MNTIIDAGSTLDTISELKVAWEGGDSTLNTAITALTTTASTDRALIRTQFVAADTALLNTFEAADDVLEARLDDTDASVVALGSTVLLQHTPQILALP